MCGGERRCAWRPWATVAASAITRATARAAPEPATQRVSLCGPVWLVQEDETRGELLTDLEQAIEKTELRLEAVNDRLKTTLEQA